MAINDYLLVLSGEDGGRLPSRVIRHLRDFGVDVLNINYDKNEEFSIQILNDFDIRIEANGKIYGTPHCFWCRFKLTVGTAGIGTPDECIRTMEWSALARGLGVLLEPVAFNSSASKFINETKPYQLSLARKSGFKVPNSVIAFGKQAAQKFIDSEPDVVMKALGYPIVPCPDSPDGRSPIITTRVDRSAFAAAGDEAFLNNPILFQHQIRSGTEYRVIAFADQIYAYRIDDDVTKRRLADSRVFQRPFRLVEASERLEALCLEYMRISGLNYGVFDPFADEYEENWWFLECNPEGQFISAAGNNYEEVMYVAAEKIYQMYLTNKERIRAAS